MSDKINIELKKQDITVDIKKQSIELSFPGTQGVPGPEGPIGPAGTTDYTQLLNVPTEFPPATHTHTESEITDLDKYTQAETDSLLNAKLDETSYTASDVKAKYESNANTNAFTDAQVSKLAGIEENATSDQTANEIETLYEGLVNTNKFTDAEKTKLLNTPNDAMSTADYDSNDDGRVDSADQISDGTTTYTPVVLKEQLDTALKSLDQHAIGEYGTDASVFQASAVYDATYNAIRLQIHNQYLNDPNNVPPGQRRFNNITRTGNKAIYGITFMDDDLLSNFRAIEYSLTTEAIGVNGNTAIQSSYLNIIVNPEGDGDPANNRIIVTQINPFDTFTSAGLTWEKFIAKRDDDVWKIVGTATGGLPTHGSATGGKLSDFVQSFPNAVVSGAGHATDAGMPYDTKVGGLLLVVGGSTTMSGSTTQKATCYAKGIRIRTSTNYIDAVDLQNSLDSKANTTHTHVIADIASLQTELDTILDQEQVQDIVGAMFQSGSHNNVSVTYDDVAGTISLTANPGTDQEAIEDVVGGLISGQNGITATYDDVNNIFTIALSGISFTTADKNAITTNTAHGIATNNPHNVTKAQVGLLNVDNTSDADKPISTAVSTALAGKSDTTHSHTEFQELSDADDAQDSKGLQLVKNGTGALGDNTNFSLFTFDPTDSAPGSAGMFIVTSNHGTFFNDEYLPVDPNKVYSISMSVRNITDGGQTALLGAVLYDSDFQRIDALFHMYEDGAVGGASLSRDRKNGDSYMYLDKNPERDLSSNVSYRLGVIFWDYVGQSGRVYPEYTYSRRLLFPIFALNATVEGPTGGAYSGTGECRIATTPATSNYLGSDTVLAGTRVSRSNAGSTFKYNVAANPVLSTTDFQYYEGEIGGIDTSGKNRGQNFPYATAYVRVLILPNRGAGSTQTQAYSGISMGYAEGKKLNELSSGAGTYFTIEDDFLKTTLNQTTTGVLTFTQSPIVPTPTTLTAVANKGYVDDAIAGGEPMFAGTTVNTNNIITGTTTVIGNALGKIPRIMRLRMDGIYLPTGAILTSSGLASPTTQLCFGYNNLSNASYTRSGAVVTFEQPGGNIFYSAVVTFQTNTITLTWTELSPVPNTEMILAFELYP